MRFWRRWLSISILATANFAVANLMAQTKWHHRYAEVNGVKLHYVEQGKGELILFLHGFPEFWYEWKDQLPEFGKDHRAVAPDMRGYNLSEKPAGVDHYQMKELVEDVRALAQHLGYKKFIPVSYTHLQDLRWTGSGNARRTLELAGPACDLCRRNVRWRDAGSAGERQYWPDAQASRMDRDFDR